MSNFRLYGKPPYTLAVIHGDYDPHPAEDVRNPLSRLLPNFQFFLLKQCGHKPWIEQQAASEFYRILKKAIQT